MNMTDPSEHMSQINALAPISKMTHTAVRDGDWTDPSTWKGGKVPGAEANVYIPKDITVTYDVSKEVPLNVIRVEGNLTWARDISTEMLVETIVSTKGSEIEIGSMHNTAIDAGVTATITFRDTPINTSSDPEKLGHGLVAMGHVDVMGAEKETHLVIKGGASAGARSIEVEGDSTNWKAGDTILLVGTGNGSRDEERTITSVKGDTITFDKALSYSHRPPAGLDVDTYVGNLSHNVIFTSENPEGVRGHVMLMNDMVDHGEFANSVMFAEFLNMGRTDSNRETGTNANPEGRYPLHMHEIGTDPDSPSNMIQGNSVNGTPGWGIVQHSSNAMVNDNIVYNAVGAGIVSEDGDETGMWIGNLVTSVASSAYKPSGSDGGPSQIGTEGAAFENQSRVIIQQDNIAANSKIGWNFFGIEDFPEDDGGAPKDGIHRKMFERGQLPFDPSPFDVALDHEEPPIIDFNGNQVIASDVGLRVFHRQFSDDTDTMSLFKQFDVWGGGDAVRLDNYASNYMFIDSVWQGSGEGFRIERKTSSAVLNDVEMHGFKIGYHSFGANHEAVLIDTSFSNVNTKFDIEDVMRNVSSDSLRKELVAYFKNHGIDYNNPMPQIVNSSSLTERKAVTFTADAGSDLTLGPSDRSLSFTGTITDSVGTRRFNEYTIAKTPSGTGTSKDFEGIHINLASRESSDQKEFTLDQFLDLHGAFLKSDGKWVSPVVNWINDRLTGDVHPVIIEIKLVGFAASELAKYKLEAYPDPGINNPDWFLANDIDEPDPVEPDPVEPDPVEPDPVEPDPVEPDPVDPKPVDKVILGTDGRDTLVGTSGNDIIDGGAGKDKMTGGKGADTFRFGSDALDGYRDDVLDFSIKDGDTIDLSLIAEAYGLSAEEMSGLVSFRDIKPGMRVTVEADGKTHAIAVLHDVETEAFLNSDALVIAPMDRTSGSNMQEDAGLGNTGEDFSSLTLQTAFHDLFG